MLHIKSNSKWLLPTSASIPYVESHLNNNIFRLYIDFPLYVYFLQTPIAAVKEETYPYKESIHQYDYGWWKLGNFAPLPQRTCESSMIVADGRLYMAGSKNSSSNVGGFYRYDAEQNNWISLQPMRKVTNHYHLVYLNGFIYVVYGNACRWAGDKERYDISHNRWENVRQLPLTPRLFSAVTFKRKIFASVLVWDTEPEFQDYFELLIYHPSKGTWQRTDVLKERDSARDINYFLSKSLLFVDKEQCYRIVTERNVDLDIRTVSVSILDVQVDEDGEVICTIKDEIKQDHKPDGNNTFRIHDEVFVYDYETGFVYYIGTKKLVGPDLRTKEYKMTSNIVMFTYDQRKVL